MFLSGADDDDDTDFTPASSSKLSALFGGSSSKSSSLKYVPPKQPRSDSTGATGEKNNSVAQGPQSQSQQQTPVVLMATAVHAYLYVSGVAEAQGRVMCCVLGNVLERNFDLLLYRSKEDHLTRVRIHQNFTFSVLPNNYASFSDDRQRSWSVMLDTGQYVDFVTQIGVCRALAAPLGNKEQHLIQDVFNGEGPLLKEGDQAQISYSAWSIKNGKKGDQLEEPKSGQRVKLKDVLGSWQAGLLGAQKCCRRLIYVPSAKDPSVIFYDVTVDRVKQKGGGDQSGRNTPQVDLQQQHKEISSSNRSLNILPEDTESDASVPASKATIVSRMARMGHALLPAGVVSARHPPTDSESEVEEINMRRKQKYNSGSISGSVEELEATPAFRSRTPSTRSDGIKPEPAPRPAHLSTQPQQLVVYQSPWQQPAIMPPGYAAVQPVVQQGGQTLVGTSQPPPPAAPDPTLSLLFSETRSQNTELKISVSKMSDKIDSLSSKIEKMEQQLHQGGSAAQSAALVPSRLVASQFDLHSTNTFDAQSVLAQITAIVSDNEEMKSKVEEKDKRIISLNDSVTQLLQKNQKLLEEKTDMLMAKQQESGTTVSITEVLALREEKVGLSAQLGAAQNQLTTLKEELSQAKKTIEKQEEEVCSLKIQVQDEQSKRLESESSSQTYIGKEVEFRQTIQELMAETGNLKTALSTLEAQKQTAQQECTDLFNKKKEVEEKLKAAENQQESLKEKLQSTVHQVQERTRGDGESSGEKELEDQLREEVQSKTSRITQLEQEISALQSSLTEMKKENIQHMNEYEAQLQIVKTEKEALEKSYANVQNASTKPEAVIGLVKKVMNSVFRTLKPQFSDEEMYSGATVMQTLLSVIRDTTLQLLEDVDKKKIEESGPVELETSDTVEARGNGAVNVGVMQTNTGDDCSKHMSGSDNNSCAVSSVSNHNCENRSENNHAVNNEMFSEGSKLGGESNTESGTGKSNGKEREIEDSEPKAENSSSEGEYTDASERQFSSKSSISSSDSNSYECEKSLNSFSLGSGKDKEVDAVITQADADEGSVNTPHIDIVSDQRTPVIDMENTEARTVTNEKSDSSRDSSLDRAWRPQPPPPPLFSDEEDDDDWLS